MNNLVTVQKHLTLANERVQELEYTLAETIHVHHGQRKTIHVLSWTLAFAVCATLYLGYNSMKYGAENRWFARELGKSEGKTHKVAEVLQLSNDRVDELETANEQLIEHCSPTNANRAIRATPLPLRGV